MEPGGGQADQGVPRPDAVGPEEGILLHDAHAEPGQVEPPRLEDPRVLRGLPAQERAARPPAALRDPRHDPGRLLRVEPADRQVVQEEQGLGPGAGHVVGAHRDEVDPDGVEPPGQPGHLDLGPHPVGRRREEPPAADPEQPREPPDAPHHLGPRGPVGEVADQLHGPGGRAEVDAGPPVGLAHGSRARPVEGTSVTTSRGARGGTSRPPPAPAPGTRRRSRPGRTPPWASRWRRSSPRARGSRGSRRR